MRKPLVGAILGLLAALVFSSVAMAQSAPAQSRGNEIHSAWKYYPKDIPVGDGGPAPKRDLTGTWNGPGSSDAIPTKRGMT